MLSDSYNNLSDSYGVVTIGVIRRELIENCAFIYRERIDFCDGNGNAIEIML